MLRSMECEGGDRVVQKYVEKPLTLRGGRKFDVRTYVLVKSFSPLVAYRLDTVHARLANKPYSSDVVDFEVNFTISLYQADFKHGQKLYTPEQLQSELGEEGIEWSDVKHKIHTSMRELFGAAGDVVGSWPRSRGLYASDIMIEAGTLQPKVLEVNYWPDLDYPLKIYPTFADDVCKLLFTDEPVSEIFLPLHEDVNV